MKRVFALIMALCLFAAMLPMAVMADTTPTETVPAETVPAETVPAETVPAATASVKVAFENSVASDFSIAVEPGATAYVVTDEALQFVKWTGAEAPTDKFVKLEMSAEGTILTVTMNNINVDSQGTAYTSHAIEFPQGEYAVVLNVVGENKIVEKNSACIKYNNAGGMTISGEGKLIMEVPGAASGAIWANGGDLLIKNANVDFAITPGNNSKHHAIYSSKGSVAFENSKINVNTFGGQLVFVGNGAAKVGRYTLDEATDRFITVKDCEIIANIKSTIFASTNPAVISNSTMTITKTSSSNNMFDPAPVLEGEYTAIAGLAKNADKPEKLKVYDEKKLGSYTYFHMVPGIVNLLPTEPEVTIPEVTVPEVTVPEVTVPEVTEPATQPATEATEPATQPTTEATTPATTEATTPATDDVDDTTSGSPLKIVLIAMIALVVVAGAGLGVLFYIRKKKA